MEHKSVHKIEI